MPVMRLAFLGQCLVHGYEGVETAQTFPRIVARRIETDRPGLKVTVTTESFYHPVELPRQTRRLLRHTSPDVLVIDASGYFAARTQNAIDLSSLPRGVETAHERARHLRAVAKGVLTAYPLGAQLVRLVETTGVALADGLLRPLVRRYPTPSVSEYEQLLNEAIRLCDGRPKVVLQGPGMFNDDESDRVYSPSTRDVYRQVRAMVRRVAEAHDLVFVDRMDVTGDRAVFLPGSIRFSVRGHQVMGDALAEAMLRSGIIYR